MLNKETIVNIKKIVRYLELKSQLTAEELQMAETMVGLTESDKEALAGLLQPVKVSKPAKKRKYERCEVCNLTRRADTHTDKDMGGYHEFVQSESAAKKSARASGLAATLGNRSRKPPQPAMCVECGEARAHENHNVETGHEFTTDLAGRVNAQLVGHEYCLAMVDDNGGEIACGKTMDDNIHHKQTDPDYHEFVGSETAVGVGGD